MKKKISKLFKKSFPIFEITTFIFWGGVGILVLGWLSRSERIFGAGAYVIGALLLFYIFNVLKLLAQSIFFSIVPSKNAPFDRKTSMMNSFVLMLMPLMGLELFFALKSGFWAIFIFHTLFLNLLLICCGSFALYPERAKELFRKKTTAFFMTAMIALFIWGSYPFALDGFGLKTKTVNGTAKLHVEPDWGVETAVCQGSIMIRTAEGKAEVYKIMCTTFYSSLLRGLRMDSVWAGPYDFKILPNSKWIIEINPEVVRKSNGAGTN